MFLQKNFKWFFCLELLYLAIWVPVCLHGYFGGLGTPKLQAWKTLTVDSHLITGNSTNHSRKLYS